MRWVFKVIVFSALFTAEFSSLLIYKINKMSSVLLFLYHYEMGFVKLFLPFFFRIFCLADLQSNHNVTSLILAALSDVKALISSRPLVLSRKPYLPIFQQ
jgi:hypothetical protein